MEGPALDDEFSAAEANRLFYAEYAERYEDVEQCIVDARAQEILRRTLVAAVEARSRATASEAIHILDACGGAGNVSLMLMREFGVGRSTLVDVSPEMLRRCRLRADAEGWDIQTVESEIAAHLSKSGERYDLIVFSSALHHLDDYEAVALLAAERLAPGGVLVTAFDPVPMGAVGVWIRRLDWLAGLFVRSPREFARVVRGRIRRSRSEESPSASIGRRAELHALDGVDDLSLVNLLQRNGMEIVEHERYGHYRLASANWIAERLGQPSTFNLIAIRP